MSEQQSSTELIVTVEQLFKLVQQNIRLWARPGALERVYAQATELAQYLDYCYHQTPDKVIAQLHLHKPHFDYLTNLTAKAAIFATDQVSQLQWTRHSRISIIAATLTTNVAVLPHLLKQNRGEKLNDKQKMAVSKSASLSYQLLKKNKVLDPLWLHAVLTSSAVKASKHYPTGIQGMLIRNAYRFAKPLCRNQSVDNVSVSQILRQVYLDESHQSCRKLVENACYRIHNLGSGALVMLSNEQAALLMHQSPDGKYLAFMFASQTISSTGRFVMLQDKHIARQLPLYQCDQPKLYSQLWEGPLSRFAVEKEITFAPVEQTEPDIFTPPKILSNILNYLFENPNLTKISDTIAHSPELTAMLSGAATQASAQKLQISDSKHALAMLGLNRIGPILTQGVLAESIAQLHFPGKTWLGNRQRCFIQAIMFYGKYNDMVLSEELAMYGAFYLAPLFFEKPVQIKSYQLYRQHLIEPQFALTLEKLFNSQVDKSHRQKVLQLAQSWMLPKMASELFRQLSGGDGKAAKTVTSAVAVLRLACFHCHTIFNQVDINNPLLQQQLREYLATLGLTFDQFLAMQDEFLALHAPYTPLL